MAKVYFRQKEETIAITSEAITYHLNESPVEFKKAFLEKIEPLFAEKIFTNFKICRKNEKMKRINKILKEK